MSSRNYVLVLLTLTAAINFLDRQILSVLLEPIGQEFELSDSLLGLLSGIAFAAFYSILGIPIAALSDRLNRRNIIAACIALFSAMTAVCGSVTSFVQLFLARVGVGVGEAGTAPASQSIIADLFPVRERPFAMGVLASGGNIGLLMGLLVGGWVNEWYGWRAAFWVAAVPGLFLALIIRLTVPEPRRVAPPGAPGWVADTAASLVLIGKIRSFRLVALGSCLYGLSAYGIQTWMPVYYIRYHDFSTGEAGTAIALIVGVIGGAGTIFTASLCSKLSQGDLRWSCWLPCVSMGIGLPLLTGMFLTDNTGLALALFVLPGFLSSAFAGPTWAIIQELVPGNKRAMAAALNLMLFNLIGLGLGPLAVGIISDLYSPWAGDQSLRYAMVTVLLGTVLSMAYYLLASRTILGDLHTDQTISD